MGLERTAMRRFKISDLRLIFAGGLGEGEVMGAEPGDGARAEQLLRQQNDVRFLEQF